MSKYIVKILILLFFLTNNTIAKENIMILKLKDGDVKIELFNNVAPKHVERIKELANSGKYDNVVFHRVIDGFMAQTGDVKFGNSSNKDFDLRKAGMGGSDLPDLKSEFNDLPHERGTLSMARSQDPNSAGSQFFIVTSDSTFLDREYTVFGEVTDGMDVADKIVNLPRDGNDCPQQEAKMIKIGISD